MKRSFIAVMLCIITIGLAACAGGEDDTLGVQTLQPEPIPTEKENDEQKETIISDTQETETQGESQGTEIQQPEAQTEPQQPIQESQQEQSGADGDLEERLAQYRSEREGMTNVAMGNGVAGYGAPNAENYGFQMDTAEYMQNFDSRELNEAYETAKKYVEETLAITVETNAIVYACVDPRIMEIYVAEDKGVADGYDPGNIFVCEYCDNGTWQYLVLVRDGKGSDWSVIHHGGSYKE